MFSNNPRSNRLYWAALLALLTAGVAGPLSKLERIKFEMTEDVLVCMKFTGIYNVGASLSLSLSPVATRIVL